MKDAPIRPISALFLRMTPPTFVRADFARTALRRDFSAVCGGRADSSEAAVEAAVPADRKTVGCPRTMRLDWDTTRAANSEEVSTIALGPAGPFAPAGGSGVLEEPVGPSSAAVGPGGSLSVVGSACAAASLGCFPAKLPHGARIGAPAGPE